MTARDKKILGLLGFAAKARRLTVGVPLCCEAMRKGGANAPLVAVLAADAAPNTAKRMTDRCAFYGIPLLRLDASGEELAAAVGKKDGTVAALGVSEPHLAKALLTAGEAGS